jgi:small-conductance mechanosensitive channel
MGEDMCCMTSGHRKAWALLELVGACFGRPGATALMSGTNGQGQGRAMRTGQIFFFWSWRRPHLRIGSPHLPYPAIHRSLADSLTSRCRWPHYAVLHLLLLVVLVLWLLLIARLCVTVAILRSIRVLCCKLGTVGTGYGYGHTCLSSY